jgi:hypothetical protein
MPSADLCNSTNEYEIHLASTRVNYLGALAVSRTLQKSRTWEGETIFPEFVPWRLRGRSA